MEVKKKLKETMGSLQIGAVAILLIIFMFLAVIMQRMEVKNITQGVHDIVQQAVLSVAADNAYNAFNGLREGNTTAAYYSDEWNEIVSTEDVQYKLNKLLNLKKSGDDDYVKTTNGKTYFTISNLNVQYENPSVGSTSNDTRLSFVTTLTLEVPISFAGGYLQPLKKNMTVRSEYIPLY